MLVETTLGIQGTGKMSFPNLAGLIKLVRTLPKLGKRAKNV